MARRRSTLGLGNAIDFRSFGEAVSYPGIDPRQWISYGIVEGSSENDSDPEVVFDADYGPLVKVMLHPSMIPIVARVSSWVAGNGESSYYPYIKGDEVLVAIPEGSERGDCVIIGRMNNSVDKFPMNSVAGFDPTKNNFSFSRQRPPHVIEVTDTYLIQSAVTGAAIGIDSTGSVTLLNGDGSAFQMGSSAIGISSSAADKTNENLEYRLQVNIEHRNIALQIDDALLILSSSQSANPTPNIISVGDTLAISTLGVAPVEHVVSLEGITNILFYLLTYIGGFIYPTILTPAQILTGISTALSSAASTPLNSVIITSITTALNAQLPKVSGVPIQTNPGVACIGLLCG
jgi:hypothetical protein